MKSAVLASMVGSASAAHWAVIMAGSNTYGNYRHQADACHAYQIAKKNGIPELNIILLAYDDIANSSRNPFPGKVFNKPTPAGVPGVDVYAGCKIDYRGKDVNAANFLKVLSGDTSAPGPVLKSTAEDRVFVYYADHGGVGILGVPSGAAGGYIHAADINKAIETLQSNGGYKELLFYLEACESGSIFANLLKAPDAKAVTAANPSESSWGWYCAGSGTGGDMVDGKNIGSCLGDEFSVRWMEDTDAASINTETVGQQAAKLVKAVTKSHVQQYGVTSFDSEPIGNFEGNKGQLPSTDEIPRDLEGNSVDSRQVEVHQAYFQVMRAESAEQRKRAEQELAGVLAQRQAADTKFGKIASAACEGSKCLAEEVLEGQVGMLKVDCHKAALEAVVDKCGPFTDYSLRYGRLFANLCEMGMDHLAMKAAIEKGCGKSIVAIAAATTTPLPRCPIVDCNGCCAKTEEPHPLFAETPVSHCLSIKAEKTCGADIKCRWSTGPVTPANATSFVAFDAHRPTGCTGGTASLTCYQSHSLESLKKYMAATLEDQQYNKTTHCKPEIAWSPLQDTEKHMAHAGTCSDCAGLQNYPFGPWITQMGPPGEVASGVFAYDFYWEAQAVVV